MRVSEIFFSIQGESTMAGFPCLFLRFFGCNLHCNWCDTKYAVQNWVKNPKEGRDYKSMSTRRILNTIRAMNVNYICLTGGEPLIQEGINELVERLGKEKRQVEIRTNGTKDTLLLKRLNPNLRIVMDVKCPGSGMEQVEKQTVIRNFEALEPKDEAVFVIQDKKDYNYAKNFIKHHQTQATINFSSVFDKLSYQKLAEWILKDRLAVRLNVQLHKFIWGVSKRGV